MLGGLLLFGYCLAVMAATLANLDTCRVHYQERLFAVNQFMKDRKIGKDLQVTPGFNACVSPLCAFYVGSHKDSHVNLNYRSYYLYVVLMIFLNRMNTFHNIIPPSPVY